MTLNSNALLLEAVSRIISCVMELPNAMTHPMNEIALQVKGNCIVMTT